MQEIEKEIEKILKYQGTLYYKNHHEVIICGRCSGIGTYIDDNVTNRVSCQQCKGDGRLVKKTTTVTFNDYMSTTLVPYIDEPVPYNNEIETFRIKIDKREYYYEKNIQNWLN